MFFVSAWREESCLAGSRREETKLSLREVKHHKLNFKVSERFFFLLHFSVPCFLSGIFLWFYLWWCLLLLLLLFIPLCVKSDSKKFPKTRNYEI